MPVPDQYWATLDSELAAEKVVTKVQNYAQAEQFAAVAERQLLAWQHYFSISADGTHLSSQVLRGGDVGELAEVRVNHSRALISTLLNLIVSNAVIWKPKAVNGDAASTRQCELAAAVLEYYWGEKRVAAHATEGLEHALVLGEGFTICDWDSGAGDDVQADPVNPTQVIKSGAPVFQSVLPWDVLRDPAKMSWSDVEWVILRLRVNRWNLAAKYAPEAPAVEGQPFAPNPLREDILSCVPDVDLSPRQLTQWEETDDLVVYRLLHRRTAALPPGRDMMVLPNGTVLYDEELSTADWPLFRVAPSEQFGSPYGYTPYFDILGVQELADSLNTSVASNQSTLATQCVVLEEGSETPFDQIAGGMKAIYVPRGSNFKPEALQLLRTPAEVFQYLQRLKSDQEQLIGLNSVVRGEAPSGEMSGSAMALLDTAALRQSSVSQGNWLRYVQSMGQHLLELFQLRATMPQKIALTGKASAQFISEGQFTGEDLALVKKVVVETGNPMSQTPAGRYEMAKELLTLMGPEKLPVEQLITVLNTGRLAPITESLTNELTLIRAENEELLTGSNPPSVILDDHRLHAREHRAILANPQVRRDPAIVGAILEHIQEHERLYYSAPPQTLALVGQQPPQQPVQQPPTPGQPQPQGGPQRDGMPNTKAARQPKLPEQPRDPRTGKQHDPTAVGQPGPVPMQPA